MYFDNLHDLFFMAGHGVYVWASYVITFIALAGLIIYPLRKKQKALTAIKQRLMFDQENTDGNAS